MPNFETPDELANAILNGLNPKRIENLAQRIREAARNEVVLQSLSGLKRHPEIEPRSLLDAEPLLRNILKAFGSPGFEITASAAGELDCITRGANNGEVIGLALVATGEQAAMIYACVEKVNEIVQS